MGDEYLPDWAMKRIFDAVSASYRAGQIEAETELAAARDALMDLREFGRVLMYSTLESERLIGEAIRDRAGAALP